MKWGTQRRLFSYSPTFPSHLPPPHLLSTVFPLVRAPSYKFECSVLTVGTHAVFSCIFCFLSLGGTVITREGFWCNLMVLLLFPLHAGNPEIPEPCSFSVLLAISFPREISARQGRATNENQLLNQHLVILNEGLSDKRQSLSLWLKPPSLCWGLLCLCA